jgi:hypothetical protein
LASILLAVSFTALLVDHDCSGEDCGVCANISYVLDIVRRMSVGGSPLASAAMRYLPLVRQPFMLEPSPFNVIHSLIETRVRLND